VVSLLFTSSILIDDRHCIGHLWQDVTSQSMTLPHLNTLRSVSPPKTQDDDIQDKGTVQVQCSTIVLTNI